MLNRLRYHMNSLKHQVKRDFISLGHSINQHKKFKFFRCPGCKSKLRVIRGKGKIQITCPRCGLRFPGRS